MTTWRRGWRRPVAGHAARSHDRCLPADRAASAGLGPCLRWCRQFRRV